MHIDIDVRHYLGSEGFIVQVWKDGNKPETQAFETGEATCNFLRPFNLERTPEQILKQLLDSPPRKGQKSQKVRLTAREAAKAAV